MRDTRSKHYRNFPSGLGMSESIAVLDVIPAHYRERRNAAKVLAGMSGATPRAARNWLDKNCLPKMEHWIELLACDPALRADINRLIDRAAEARCAGR